MVTCGADVPVKVELAGNRLISGEVDAQTDTQHLWLRRDEAGIRLSSGFGWVEVVRITYGEKSVSGSELLPFARRLAIARGVPGGAWPTTLKDDRSSATATVRGAGSLGTNAPARSPIQYLRVEAQLAQWDSDVQSDGLRIFVSPFDQMNRLVAVQGQVEFTLVGEIERLNGGQHGPLRPEFKQLERATQMVRLEHFAAGPAVYQLPFSRFHPDFDANIAGQALLKVCLSVPGQGVFEASDAHVSLREYSRIRDHLEFYSKQRYLPIESGGQPNR